MRELEDLDRVFFSRLQSIEKSRALVKAVTENRDITRDNVRPGTLCRQEREQRNNADSKKNFPGKEKKKKTGTKDITLHMFREGKSAEDIASERSLAVSTIEGHLSHWVSLGEIPVTHFIDPKKLDQILEVARRIESLKLNDIKARLGDEFTYSDLRFAMAHYRYIQEKKKPKA
jgi:uncharacterized protein YpbB